MLLSCYYVVVFDRGTIQTVYNRVKTYKGYRYKAVHEGPGKKTGHLEGPFYVRVTERKNGRVVQSWRNLECETFAEAKEAAEKFAAVNETAAGGLTVAEAVQLSNANRTTVKSAIDKFIEEVTNAGRARRTVAAYRLTLDEFLESLTEKRVRFCDEIAESHLLDHVGNLHKQGMSGKTIDTRATTVAGFLKANKIVARLPRHARPKYEEKPPVAFSDEELEKLFAEMNETERVRYRFFLKTGCREQEVQFAAWKDLNWTAKTFTVQSKPEVGFTVKKHESRTIPLRDDLVKELKTYHESNGSSRWIFPSTHDLPDGHMLRKFKKIAYRAGLNCGHCTAIENGEEVSCADGPYCEHFFLHRLRKTCATRWDRDGVRVRDIQHLLGHKSLEITQKYLGLSNDSDLRKRINSGD